MFFLAEFTPFSPQTQLAAASALGLALAIFTIWSFFRRTPPLDSELVKLNGAIAGLQKSVEDLTTTQRSHASHATEIEALHEKVRVLEAHRERDLQSQHTHRERDLQSQRTYTRETTREIFEKLDRVAEVFSEKVEKVSASFSHNVQQFEGAMGRLEGTAEQLSKRLDNLER